MAISDTYYIDLSGHETTDELPKGQYIIKYTGVKSSSDYMSTDDLYKLTLARGANAYGNKVSAETYTASSTAGGQMPIIVTDTSPRYMQWDTTALTPDNTSDATYLRSIPYLHNNGMRYIMDMEIQRFLLSIDIMSSSMYGYNFYTISSQSMKYATGANVDFVDADTQANSIDVKAGFAVLTSTGVNWYSITDNAPYTKMFWEYPPVVRSALSTTCYSMQSGTTNYDLSPAGVPDFQWLHNTDGGNEPEMGGGTDDFLICYSASTIIIRAKKEETLLRQVANLGFAFKYNGTIYKPVVNGGVVTGYTDDLLSKSEWDDWKHIGDHTFPDSSDPKSKDDGIKDMELGFTGYENGFVNYYICTAGNISKLVEEMSAQTDYPNLMGNIVSLKSYACTLNGMYTGNNTAIKVGQYQSTATGTKITTTTYSKQIASFTIKGAHGTLSKPHFLDYSPYTRLEVYIPFCGTVPLPPEVMYNTVSVHIVTDITSGSCTGVVKCNGNIVAQKSGIIGTTIPLSVNDSASQNNAFNQGMMNTAITGGKVIAGGAVGSVNAGGILSALGSAFNTTQTMNDNFTRVIGTQGDKSAYAMPKKCYLKRYRTIDLSDDNYTASIGRPVCKRRALSSGDGFTVCDNPQVYGSMTLAEKNEIEQFMRNGIIL